MEMQYNTVVCNCAAVQYISGAGNIQHEYFATKMMKS